MDPTPLADRSTNTLLPLQAKDEKKADDMKSAPADLSSSLEYHRQVLQGKLGNGEKYATTSADNYRSLAYNEANRHA